MAHGQVPERWRAVARRTGTKCEGLRGWVEMVSQTWDDRLLVVSGGRAFQEAAGQGEVP